MSADNINWDRVSLSNFSSKLLDSREWFSTATELVSAAEILAPHVIDWWDSLHEWSKDSRKIFNEYGYHSLFMMLYAYAIENLCKGYMVGRLSWKPHLSRVGR